METINRIEYFDDGTDLSFFDKEKGQNYFFISSDRTRKQQASNKQETNKDHAGNKQGTNKQQLSNNEVALRLYSEIEKKMQQVATIKRKSKLAQLQMQLWIETSVAAKNEHDKYALREINHQIQVYLNKAIDGATKGRSKLQKFDKAKHLQQNKVAAWFLQNSKFIKVASESKYKSFDDLTQYVPYSIVSAINEKKVHQANGEPHTVKTLTYLADIIREKRQLDMIKRKRNRKIKATALFITILATLIYVRVATNEPLQLNTTFLQPEVAKTWNVTEITDLVQLYATSEEVFVSEWRTGKILEVAQNRNLTETELIFKIDSVVNYKYNKK